MAFSRTNMVSQGQISASHSLQIIKCLEGDSGQGQPIALTALNSGSAFTLDVKNAGSGGALRVQNTSGTALLTVNNSGVQIATGTITTAITALPVSATWNAAGVTFLGADVAITRTAAAAASRLFRVRQDGNVIFSVAAVASAATGLLVTPAAAASGLDLSVVTTGTNENLTLNAAGSGTITFGNTSTGNIVSTRLHTFSAGATVTGAVTFTTNAISTTALATPSALAATQFTAFASTVSGAAIMGYGTTNDVSLLNRAGTVVLGVTANTSNVTMAGALAITGALSGVTTLAVSGTATMTGITATSFSSTGNVDMVSGGVTTRITQSGGGLLGTSSNHAMQFMANNTIYATLGATGGLQMGAPTGGDKGSGTINTAADIYKNNGAYTNPDYVLEHWATGQIVKYADKLGAVDYRGLMPLQSVEQFARENWHLPRFGQDTGRGLFDGSDYLLATVEESYLHLFSHEHRIVALERELQALRAGRGN